MSSVLASVLRRCLVPCCCSRSSLQTAVAVHPSILRLLFFVIVSAIFLFCCKSMLLRSDDDRHFLPRSRQQQLQQPNQFISSNVSRSRSMSFLHVAPVAPLSSLVHHRDVDSDSEEFQGRLLRSGSTRIPGELHVGPDDEGHRSTTLQPKSKSNFTSGEWLELQRSRKSLLRRICDGHSRNTDSLRECGFRLDGLLIDRSNHILYCAIPKVASSSVKLAFALMAGQINRTSSNDAQVHLPSWLRSVGIYSVDYLVENDPIWLKSAWSSLRKFVIVRHPFERLVSAFVDKFTLRNKFTDFFQRRFGRQIVRLYRNRSELRHRGGGAMDDDVGRDVKFGEFVRFLVDKRIRCTQKLNPHWMSFVDVCHPCLVDYDYIVHFEGLTGEMLHLWKAIYNQTNLDDVLQRRNVGQTKTSNLVAGYMNRLPAKDVEALHEQFSIDFKMFAYT